MKLYNARLELTTLRTMCDGPTRLKSNLVARLSTEHFYSVAAREAVSRLKAIIRSTGDIPSYAEVCSDPVISETARETLSKFKGDMFANEKEAKGGFKALNHYYKMRCIYHLSESVNSKLLKDKVDVEALMESMANDLNKARINPGDNVPIYHLGKGSNSSSIIKKMLGDEKPDLIPTGFKAYDKRNGGLQLGSLVLIGANTGGGKSTMAIQLLKNMAEYCESVAYVPLEMTEDETYARLSANLARVPLTKIINKQCTKAEKHKIYDALKNFDAHVKKNDNRWTVYSPEEDVTIDDVLITLKPYGHRVILIDYVSLLKGVDDENSWQQLGKVARFCKIYAKNNNMIIILLVQINDEGKVRYSKAMVEHANNAFFWTSTDETRENGIIEVRQEKARNQQMFNFQLRFEPEFMHFCDVDDDGNDDVDEDLKEKREARAEKRKDKSGKTGVKRRNNDEDSGKSKKRSRDKDDDYLDSDLEDIGSNDDED